MFFNAPRIITTSIPKKKANAFVLNLVSRKLIACAQIHDDIQSVYLWHGKIIKDREAVIVMKTLKRNISAIKFFFKEYHPYEVPEFIVHKFNGTNQYIDWIKRETQ